MDSSQTASVLIRGHPSSFRSTHTHLDTHRLIYMCFRHACRLPEQAAFKERWLTLTTAWSRCQRLVEHRHQQAFGVPGADQLMSGSCKQPDEHRRLQPPAGYAGREAGADAGEVQRMRRNAEVLMEASDGLLAFARARLGPPASPAQVHSSRVPAIRLPQITVGLD